MNEIIAGTCLRSHRTAQRNPLVEDDPIITALFAGRIHGHVRQDGADMALHDLIGAFQIVLSAAGSSIQAV